MGEVPGAPPQAARDRRDRRPPGAPRRRSGVPRAALDRALVVLLALTARRRRPGEHRRRHPVRSGSASVWQALLDPDLASEDAVIVRQLRVPRTVARACWSALALGLAGALMQGHTRNPLADPGLLGVNAGAAFAVVLADLRCSASTTPAGYVWFAFAGALAGSVVVFAIGSAGSGGATPGHPGARRGRAVARCCYALDRAVLLGDQQTLDAYRFWVVGSLAGRGRRRRLAGGSRSSSSALLLAVVNAPALNAARPRRGRRPRRSGQRSGWPGPSASPRSPCSPAPPPPPAARSPSSAWSCRTSPARSPAPTTAGCCPTPACRARSCCSSPTCSAGSWSAPASCRSASCSPLVGAPFFIALVRRRKLVRL